MGRADLGLQGDGQLERSLLAHPILGQQLATGRGVPRSSRDGRYCHRMQTQKAMAKVRRAREVTAEWHEVSKITPIRDFGITGQRSISASHGNHI